jgi:PAS domain S-box-containing protein/diguanylate cyclase (GGDEF)-like protein
MASPPSPLSPVRSRSIAVDLALLVGAVAVPLGILAAYFVYDSMQRQIEQSSGVVRQIAATTADRARNYVDSVRATLEAVARRPSIQAMDPARCDATLPELLKLFPSVANVIVVDLEGRILCGAIPPPSDRAVYIVDKSVLADMIAQPGFILSRPLITRIGRQWSVAAIQPVFGPGGQMVGTVNFAIDLRHWISFSGIDGLANGAVVGIVSTEGVIIGRSHEPEKWIGRDVSEGEIHKRAAVLKQGTLRTTGVAGIERLWAFTPVPGAGWYALAGLPVERVYGPVWRRVIESATLVLAVLALALVFALMLSRRLQEPLRAIVKAARARAAGRGDVRVPVSGPREIAGLAQELNRMMDVDDRLQQAVRESEERYRRLADYSPDPTLIHSEHRIVLVNRAMLDLLGARDAAQLLGQSATMMLPPDVAPAAEERIGRLYAGQMLPRVEQVYRRIDGGLVDVEISSAPILFDGKPAAHVTARDITARRRQDEEMRRFRAAMDISGDAILLIDRASLRYIDVNRTFCELVGYGREEVLGMTPMDVFSADRATLERDYDAIIADANCPASRIEGWYRRKDGTRFQVETRRRALQTQGGWIIVATARDITERKEAEEKIARLNRVYAVLSGINAAIVRIGNRDELFAEACRIAVEHGRMQTAWMGVVDREAQEVRVVAWQGGNEAFVKSLRGRTSMRVDKPGDAGIVARAVASRAPVVSNDVSADDRVKLRGELAALGVRSLAVLPIVLDGETAALLALHAADAGYFDEPEMKLLADLAGDIAFAMQHLRQQEKLDYLAYYDSLTGLANRNLFLERLKQAIHSTGQAGEKLGLAVLDVERLRAVNDSLGRQAGDALLKAIAGRLARAADRGELARISADHFGVVLPAVKGRSAVMRRLERLWQDCFGAPFVLEGTELRVAGKAGLALFPNDGVDAESLIRNAEAALRRAKQTGERHVFHAAEMTEHSAEKLSLENRLRRALEREEFVLHYQPKIELESRRIVGVEALIRWQSPELGLVPPGQFIPLMEETGMILEAGAWAMDRAVRDHQRWVEMGLRAPRVAVNVSAVQLRKKDYLETLARSLARGATPAGIDLEITESLVMEDIQGNIEKLKEALKLGVTIAIDDFGTGYSSLSYLPGCRCRRSRSTARSSSPCWPSRTP